MADIEQTAADRARFMPEGAKRWFTSDFDLDADLRDSDVSDLCTTTPGWVCSLDDLTPLGRVVYRTLKDQALNGEKTDG